MNFYKISKDKKDLMMNQFTEILEHKYGKDSLSALPRGMIFWRNDFYDMGIIEENAKTLVYSDNLDEDFINEFKKDKIEFILTN